MITRGILVALAVFALWARCGAQTPSCVFANEQPAIAVMPGNPEYDEHLKPFISRLPGTEVSSFPDLNGDGYSDILVSNRSLNRVTVFSGKATWRWETDSIGRPTPDYEGEHEPLLEVTGSGVNFGFDIAPIFDIDGLGTPGFVVGEWDWMSDTGRVLIYSCSSFVSGAATPQAPVLVSEIAGPAGSTQFGWDVCSLGDLDGDGADEIAVGAIRFDQLGGGIVYVVSSAEFLSNANFAINNLSSPTNALVALDAKIDPQITGFSPTTAPPGFNTTDFLSSPTNTFGFVVAAESNSIVTGGRTVRLMVGAPGTDTPDGQGGRNVAAGACFVFELTVENGMFSWQLLHTVVGDRQFENVGIDQTSVGDIVGDGGTYAYIGRPGMKPTEAGYELTPPPGGGYGGWALVTPGTIHLEGLTENYYGRSQNIDLSNLTTGIDAPPTFLNTYDLGPISGSPAVSFPTLAQVMAPPTLGTPPTLAAAFPAFDYARAYNDLVMFLPRWGAYLGGDDNLDASLDADFDGDGQNDFAVSAYRYCNEAHEQSPVLPVDFVASCDALGVGAVSLWLSEGAVGIGNVRAPLMFEGWDGALSNSVEKNVVVGSRETTLSECQTGTSWYAPGFVLRNGGPEASLYGECLDVLLRSSDVDLPRILTGYSSSNDLEVLQPYGAISIEKVHTEDDDPVIEWKPKPRVGSPGGGVDWFNGTLCVDYLPGQTIPADTTVRLFVSRGIGILDDDGLTTGDDSYVPCLLGAELHCIVSGFPTGPSPIKLFEIDEDDPSGAYTPTPNVANHIDAQLVTVDITADVVAANGTAVLPFRLDASFYTVTGLRPCDTFYMQVLITKAPGSPEFDLQTSNVVAIRMAP